MIFSYNTSLNNFTLNNGYGRAGWGIINALKAGGHKVGFDYAPAPVQLTFAQPDYFEPIDGQYQIILCPWESTELPEGWIDKFHEADEVWATSDWVADVYRKAGVENVTTVYPHGIEKRYVPKLKKRQGPLRFVNLGGPANRKGSQEAFDAFREVFKDDPRRATLTIKAYQRSLVRWYDKWGSVRDPGELPNVRVVTQTMELDALVKFTNTFNASIYPSYGEGFGFLPLETLAQATPTISTYDWAHYRDYLSLGIDADMIESPWPWEHPGMVYKPNMESLIKQIQSVEENYDEIASEHFRQSLTLHNEYNWDILTQNAFERIVEKFN